MSRRSAFTLLELLVSVSVVALLTTIALPGLSRARSRASGLSCVANLKQWGIATMIYCADNDDFLPPDGTPNPGPNATNTGWYIQLPAAIGVPRYKDLPWHTNASEPLPRSLWLCPANRRRSNGRNLFHYCLNQNVNGTGADAQPIRLSSIDSPTSLVWLFDSKNLPAVGPRSYTHTNLHVRGANFLFLDGHVRRYSASEYWDFESNRPLQAGLPFAWNP